MALDNNQLCGVRAVCALLSCLSRCSPCVLRISIPHGCCGTRINIRSFDHRCVVYLVPHCTSSDKLYKSAFRSFEVRTCSLIHILKFYSSICVPIKWNLELPYLPRMHVFPLRMGREPLRVAFLKSIQPFITKLYILGFFPPFFHFCKSLHNQMGFSTELGL